MKLSIYNTYIPVTSQEQADRLKQICLDNGLPIRKEQNAFYYDADEECVFEYGVISEAFAVYYSFKYIEADKSKEINETDFINLLKQLKK